MCYINEEVYLISADARNQKQKSNNVQVFFDTCKAADGFYTDLDVYPINLAHSKL